MAKKGSTQSEDVKNKIRNALLGRKHTKERCLNMSKAMKGRIISPEQRAKQSKALKGRPLSEENKRNIGLALIGEKNGHWNGGKTKSVEGYIYVLHKSHPFCNCSGYVAEHRLVMEKHLGRTLLSTEVVHHINGEVSDNRIENLMLFSCKGEHTRHHNNLRNNK